MSPVILGLQANRSLVSKRSGAASGDVTWFRRLRRRTLSDGTWASSVDLRKKASGWAWSRTRGCYDVVPLTGSHTTFWELT